MRSAGSSAELERRRRTRSHLCAIDREFCIMLAAIKAALDDLKGGYFFEPKVLLEAEIFSDLLEQAEELQKAGYKDAAAVLAGGVLEKHMRSMCSRRGIGLLKPNGKHKMLNDMNDELAKAGAYNALKKKQVTAWATCGTTQPTGTHPHTPAATWTPSCGTCRTSVPT